MPTTPTTSGMCSKSAVSPVCAVKRSQSATCVCCGPVGMAQCAQCVPTSGQQSRERRMKMESSSCYRQEVTKHMGMEAWLTERSIQDFAKIIFE